MLKYYITVSFRQFTKTLNQFFYLSSANKNEETCTHVWFEQLKKLKSFWGTFSGQYLNIWKLFQKI